jgi:hypothetical protein
MPLKLVFFYDFYLLYQNKQLFWLKLLKEKQFVFTGLFD